MNNFIEKFHHENNDKFIEKIKDTNTKVNLLAEKVAGYRSLEKEPEKVAEKVAKLRNISPMEIVKKAADHIPQIVKIAADPTHQIAEKVAEKVDEPSLKSPMDKEFREQKGNTRLAGWQVYLGEESKCSAKNIDPNIDTSTKVLMDIINEKDKLLIEKEK